MPGYKIYAVELDRFGTPGVIITTAFKNAGGYSKAEAFFIVPGEDEVRDSIRLRFDQKSFGDSPVELNDDFMFEEALAKAKYWVGFYLDDLARQKPHRVSNRVNHAESDINILVRLRVRGQGESLFQVYRFTECDSLKGDLRPVLNLPLLNHRGM